MHDVGVILRRLEEITPDSRSSLSRARTVLVLQQGIEYRSWCTGSELASALECERRNATRASVSPPSLSQANGGARRSLVLKS